MSYLTQLALIVAAYIVGSIPTGYVLAYFSGIRDIRNHGSGNIGATNVARILGFHYFVPVFVMDASKAALYLMAAKGYGCDEALVLTSALALLAGNSYSLFLQLTGGKGFATTTGILFVLKPGLALLLACLWMSTVAFTRTVGIASATTCAGLVVSGLYFFSSDVYLSLTFVCIGAWGIWRHVDNIKRYLRLPID